MTRQGKSMAARARSWAMALALLAPPADATPVGNPAALRTEPTEAGAAPGASAERAAQPAPPAQPDPAARSSSGAAPAEGARRAGALATASAIVPGLLVHGTGHFVAGDAATGRTLLALEGAGLGLLAAGGVPIVLTGASRRIVGAAAAMTIGGVALFAISALADIYGVTAPPGGFGSAPARLAAVQTEVGYRYVYNPVFAYRHFLAYGADLRSGEVRVAASAWFATDEPNSRLRLLGAYRLWHGRSTAGGVTDGSYLEWQAAATHHAYAPHRFALTTGETALAARLDLGRVGPSLGGSFAEASLGIALQTARYRISGVPTDTNELLLARFAYGIYLGGRGRAGPDGEILAYYDHRHDGFAAGLKLTGLGSGVAGHFGWEGRCFFDEHWGAAAELMAGSAYVGGVSILFRQGAAL